MRFCWKKNAAETARAVGEAPTLGVVRGFLLLHRWCYQPSLKPAWIWHQEKLCFFVYRFQFNKCSFKSDLSLQMLLFDSIPLTGRNLPSGLSTSCDSGAGRSAQRYSVKCKFFPRRWSWTYARKLLKGKETTGTGGLKNIAVCALWRFLSVMLYPFFKEMVKSIDNNQPPTTTHHHHNSNTDNKNKRKKLYSPR